MAPLPAAVVAVFAAYLACVGHGLFLLATSEDYTADQAIIGGIAQIGRGMCISVLAHLTMTAEGWAVTDQTVVHVLVSFAFVALYAELVATRSSARAAVVRPF